MDIEIINILKKHGCLYMADDYKELLTDIQEYYKQSQALQLQQTDVSSSSLNTYHIETKDGSGSFNFFTQAKDHKKALRQLETNSSDWKRIVKADRDLVITIKKVV